MGGSRWSWVLQIKFPCHSSLSLSLSLSLSTSTIAPPWRIIPVAITDFIFLRPIREKWLFGHVVAAESRRQPPPVMVQAGGVLGRRAAAAGWRRSEVFVIAAAGALLLVATVVLKAPGRAEVGACCALPPQRQLVSCVG